MEFLNRFNLSIIPNIKNYYIEYEELYNLLNNNNENDGINNESSECNELFYCLIECSFYKYKNYSLNWFNKIINEHYNDNILQDIMELNEFIIINNEGLLNLIILHDTKYPKTKLYISWRSFIYLFIFTLLINFFFIKLFLFIDGNLIFI